MSLPRSLPPAVPDPALMELFARPEGVPKAVCGQAAFYLFFARTLLPLLEHCRERLSTVYTPENGRPAWDPVRLLGVLVLQFVLRVSDRQAAELAQYDQRWRLALHLAPGEAAFDPSLLTVFRNRLVKGEQASLAFDAVLDYLVEHGWVPKRSKQRLDSTHVRGLLSLMSTLERSRETIRLLLEDVEADGVFPEVWAEHREGYVESKVDPRAQVPALEVKSLQAGRDMLAIWTYAAVHDDIKARDSFLLLQRVFLENYTLEASGESGKRRAQPTGAVQNPHEPEAQWSSKSTTRDKTWVGYKAQVAETVQEQPCQPNEPTANFLTAVVTQNAPASDKAGMADVAEEQQRMGLEPPAALYVDGAYVSSEAIKDANDEGRELRGPAPASPNRGKVYTIESFDVHVEERYAVCPAGQRSSNCSRLEEHGTGKVVYRIEWKQAVCGACPLRERCVNAGQDHRTFVVGALHTILQDRRREMLTEAFKQEMRHRNGIEGTHSELVRGYGLRQARHRGFAKVRLQNYLIGAACNIRRLFRRVQWLAAQGVLSANVATMAVTG
jgi:transposase